MAATLLAGTLAGRGSDAATIGPRVPLAQSRAYALAGDVVTAGVGMRNAGAGTIALALPGGSLVVQAFLYWAAIDRQQPSGTGVLNGHPIAGTLIAQAGDPCWPNQNAALDTADPIYIWVYRADVTPFVVDGPNDLSGFASGLTGHEDPTAAGSLSAFPLLDGASLVVVYANAGLAPRSIVINDGGETFFGGGSSTVLAIGPPGAFSPVSARTVYVVADGQASFPDDVATFANLAVAGPGGTTKPTDAFDGADGGGPAAPNGLWDTLVLEVSGLVPPGASSATAGVTSGDKLDCLTWVAQVLSVQTGPAPSTTTTTTTTRTTTTSTSTTSGSTTTATSTTAPTTTTPPTTLTTTTTTATTETSTTSTSSTVASTSSTSTTSATTTIAPSSSSTTTTTSSTVEATTTTSTTTLPGCAGRTGFDAVFCRLDAVEARVLRLPASHLRDVLVARIREARRHVQRARSFLDAGQTRAAHAVLRAAARDLLGFAFRVHSLAGRFGIGPADATELVALSEDIRAGIVALAGTT